MIDVGAAIRSGIESLESADVEYVIVGSVAASAWGVLRWSVVGTLRRG